MRVLAFIAIAIMPIRPLIAQTISPVPSAGDSTVTVSFGTALPAPESGELYSDPNAKAGDNCIASAPNIVTLKAGVPTTAAAGSKSLVLVVDKAVTQGMPICAIVSPVGGGAPQSAPYVIVGAPTSPPGYDWGRVRAYFTAGGLTSQADGQFSHEDLFLSFRLDKAYFMTTLHTSDGTYRSRMNTFYEARLTALPVAVQTCNSQAKTCSSTTNTSSSSSTTNPSTTTQTFLNSQKAALLQFGVFFPLYFPSWAVESGSGATKTKTAYALYLAPIATTGFDTSLDGLNQTQQQTSTASLVQPIGTSQQFYKFYEFGVRLGHDQLNSQDSQPPNEISYLDVGWGRYSNLSSLLCPASEYLGNNTCSAPSGTLPWRRDVRLRVEGLLQVPATKGFSVGFSTNVSFHPADRPPANTFQIQPADDLRFFFGYKFDISTIATKLAPQSF